MENVTLSTTTHSDHSPSEHNGFTMSSSSSHDAGSPPPDSNNGATPNMEKKNKKKLSIGGSFTKFWKGNKKVKDNGENFYVYTIIELLFTLTNLVLLLKFNFLHLSISLYCGHHCGFCCCELFPLWSKIPHFEVLRSQTVFKIIPQVKETLSIEL